MTMPGPRPRRRSRAARLTLAGLLTLPLIELAVAILASRAIGAAPTVLLLVLLSVGGLVVLRHSGARALRSLSAPGPETNDLRGRPRPAAPDLRDAGDAAWQLLGGLLLVLPGFVTAGVGLLLTFAPTRRLLGPLLGRGAGLLTSRLLGTSLVERVVAPRIVRGDVVDDTVTDRALGEGPNPPEHPTNPN
jgi:UPF0716 protein FxsA